MNGWPPWVGFLLLFSVLLVPAIAQAGPPEYLLVDLGNNPDGLVQSQGSAINDAGTIAGWASTIDYYPWEAARWDPVTGFQTLGGLQLDGVSWGNAINGGGTIVGWGNVPGPGPIPPEGFSRAFAWNSTLGMQDLGTLPGFENSMATGVSNSQQVVGTAWGSPSNVSQAFIWTDAQGMEPIPVVDSDASAINNQGQVVGRSSMGAYIWSALEGSQFVTGLFDPKAINDLGNVVGQTDHDGQPSTPLHAALWSPGTGLLDLGALPGASGSQALGMNDVGQVVGTSDNAPFIWNSVDGMRDLRDVIGSDISRWAFFTPLDINNSGWVVGHALYNLEGYGTIERGFLLVPVPEPSTSVFLLLACGIGIMRRAR